MSILEFVSKILKTASLHTYTVMPGYTHLRISQPITYGHWLIAKCYHFLDDVENLQYDFAKINQCPLGIFEFAGTHLPIDREYTSKLLGFDKVLNNSLYAANSRGEIEAKLLSDFSILAMHIKRTAQELLLWSTYEFGFIELDELYTTGGTAQPNLKNPDTLEIIRANSAKIYGKFLETITTIDSLTSGYNRDTQQTKQTIIESMEVIQSTVPVLSGILTSLKINKERMHAVAEVNFATAPDLSVQIAIKGNVSFREAYKVVKHIIQRKYVTKNLSELTPKLLMKASIEVLNKKIYITQKDINEVAIAKERILSVKSQGGASPKEAVQMINEVQKKVNKLKKNINITKNLISQSFEKLEKEIYKIIKKLD